MPITNVEVDFTNMDGNAFAILGSVGKALKNAGHTAINTEFQKEATSGDYDNLLRTVGKYVQITMSDTDEDEDACEDCGGSGTEWGNEDEDCPVCDGSG